MSVNTTLTLKWDGQSYNTKMTMELIDKIEEEINLVQLANQVQENDIRFSAISKFVTIVLNYAGCPVNREEVYYGMFEDDAEKIQVAVLDMTTTLLASCFIRSKKNTSEK